MREQGPTGIPRWVKVFGIIAIIVVLVVILRLVFGGIPGVHTPPGGVGDHVPPIQHGGQ
ncbi:MAG: hypothetical protein HYX91_06320 [Chloroflexi bacterium]|nr:hypothetical protein [Chloroflexota bacterium]